MTEKLEGRSLQDEDSPRLKPHLLMVGGRAMTTSLVVAKHFDKRHSDVLRAIKVAMSSVDEDFNERNFALVGYTDPKGEQRPLCQMTRDGFSYIAMGFTGGQASRWKVAYITAFNLMEEALRHKEDLDIGDARQMLAHWPAWKARFEAIEAQLVDQRKTLAELQSRLDQVNRTMSGPEELGIAMAVTGMNPAAAVVLNLLTRASYERSFTPEFTTWSVRDIANIVHWPKLGQIRSALNQLQRDGLIQVAQGRTKNAARRYRVLEVRVIEAFKRAMAEPPRTAASVVLVSDSLSPMAPTVRGQIRTDVPVTDQQAEDISEKRDGNAMFKLKLIR